MLNHENLGQQVGMKAR